MTKNWKKYAKDLENFKKGATKRISNQDRALWYIHMQVIIALKMAGFTNTQIKDAQSNAFRFIRQELKKEEVKQKHD